MWSRISQTDGKSVHRNGSEAPGGDPAARRAYYRVEGVLPIRLTPLAPEDVEAAVFDLSMPDPLCAPIGEAEGEEESPMAARLRRIEEKLDLLLKLREEERITWTGRHRPSIDGRLVYPRPVQDPIPLWIAVGPEGGWHASELELLQAHQFQPFSLGPRTLRSDTACIAAVTLAHDRSRRPPK